MKFYEVIKRTGRTAKYMSSDIETYELLKPNHSEDEVLLIFDTVKAELSIYDADCYEQDLKEVQE